MLLTKKGGSVVELVARLPAVFDVRSLNFGEEVFALLCHLDTDLQRYKVVYPSDYYSKSWQTSFLDNGPKGC